MTKVLLARSARQFLHQVERNGVNIGSVGSECILDSASPCSLFVSVAIGGLASVLTLSAAATALRGETYLSESQAVKIALPNADSVSVETKQLTQTQRERLEARSGLRFPEPQYKFFVGRLKNGQAAGYAVIMKEIGKEEYITFIVGVTPQGQVNDVAIMDFRESRGWEVREKRFLRQYRGKKSTDPLQVDRDITNYTGATLSTHAVTRGVKKALLLTGLFYLVKE